MTRWDAGTHILRFGLRLAPAVALGLAACAPPPPPDAGFPGYGEVRLVFAAALDAGRIADIAVSEGQQVAAGDVLFSLDPGRAGDAAAVAAAQANAARSRSADAAADAVAAAEAQAQLARRALARTSTLHARGLVAKARLDADQAAADAAAATLARLKAERTAALQDSRAATAQADLARRRVREVAVAAPAAGRVERLYHRKGEVVAAGAPVLALAAPENVRLVFFVPEPQVAGVGPGARLTVACDGCAPGLGAKVSFVAHEPQFTPPVIYSDDYRAALVYRVEAIPDDPARIRPGLPVTVKLSP